MGIKTIDYFIKKNVTFLTNSAMGETQNILYVVRLDLQNLEDVL